MDKGEYRGPASRLGVAVICPDTSPRGKDVPDEPHNWQFGQGAGFYLDAARTPFQTNYKMQSYLLTELPKLLKDHFPLDLARQGIFGHSMGGHGALAGGPVDAAPSSVLDTALLSSSVIAGMGVVVVPAAYDLFAASASPTRPNSRTLAASQHC
jgi:S-formylglutathione hydrolase FrmB